MHKVVRFDRFALDLTRGCLRAGDQEIDLPPKPFEVLRYLAVNAGRLVSKQELLEAVWPNVSVSDDSLVQCIRELRQKLGDIEHRLIKTVPRRGYMLDAIVTTPVRCSLSAGLAADHPDGPVRVAVRLGRLLPAAQAQRLRTWGAAAAGFVCAALAAAYLLSAHPGSKRAGPGDAASLSAQSPQVSELFSETDAKRVAELAEKKQLPLPPFQIGKPAQDVPQVIRRFVGVWVSDTGWIGSNRQFMLIITNVDKEGMAAGYFVNGPPQPDSRIQSPAQFGPIQAHVSKGSLSYKNIGGEHVASFTPQNGLEFKLTYQDGWVTMVALRSLWNLVEAEHAASTINVAR